MTKMPLLRIAVVLLVAVAACSSKSDCADCEQAKPATTATPSETIAVPTPTVAASTVRVPPWESASPAFTGCAAGCGKRLTGPTEGVVTQPGVMIGQYTFCPVSGVAFEVKAESPRRNVEGNTFYFCCEGCATYFSAHQAQVLAARGVG